MLRSPQCLLFSAPRRSAPVSAPRALRTCRRRPLPELTFFPRISGKSRQGRRPQGGSPFRSRARLFPRRSAFSYPPVLYRKGSRPPPLPLPPGFPRAASRGRTPVFSFSECCRRKRPRPRKAPRAATFSPFRSPGRAFARRFCTLPPRCIRSALP